MEILPVLLHRVRRLRGAGAVDDQVLHLRIRFRHPAWRRCWLPPSSIPAACCAPSAAGSRTSTARNQSPGGCCGSSWICLFLLSYPQTDFTIITVTGPKTFHIGLDVDAFTVIMFTMGIAFAFGKASVFKYISDDYPHNIGVISGMVGLAGGMGGFVLPIMFGALVDLTGMRSSCLHADVRHGLGVADLDVLHRSAPRRGHGPRAARLSKPRKRNRPAPGMRSNR